MTAPGRPRARIRPLALGLLLQAFAGLASPRAAQAQVPTDPAELGRVVARVVDVETGAPVAGALLTLTTLDRRALTDSTGTGIFLDVPPGSHRLRVERIGYADETVDVEVRSVTSAIVGIPLRPEAVAVAPIDVEIEHRPRYLERKGFYARRAVGHGTFFDPQFVERWNVGLWSRADRFMELLENMAPPFEGVRRGGIFCPGGQPILYIDGIRAFDDDGRLGGRRSTALEMMSTRVIGAVEMYSGSAGAPDFALDSDVGCGVIAIWTNRWRGRPVELGGGDVELCEPSEPSAVTVEGVIRDEFTDVLLPGAKVRALSYPPGRPRTARELEVVSDREGRYRLCDLPPDHRLTVQVQAGERAGPELELLVQAPRVERDLTLRLAGPGDVVGRVVDRSTGRPVAAADVRLRDSEARTQTDELGYFSLDEVRPGDGVIEIAHLGFEPLERTISIVADRTVELRVELSADPIALEPIVVTAVRDRRLELRGFYDRRTTGERLGQGVFLDRTDLEKRAVSAVSSLFRQIPGLEVRCDGARNCLVGASRRAGCDQMSVFINGSLALGETRRDPVGIDELVRPAEIAALEVYTSPASVPAEFSGMSGRCGAVVIWTG